MWPARKKKKERREKKVGYLGTGCFPPHFPAGVIHKKSRERTREKKKIGPPGLTFYYYNKRPGTEGEVLDTRKKKKRGRGKKFPDI